MANNYNYAPRPNVMVTAIWEDAINFDFFRRVERKIGGHWVETTLHPVSYLVGEPLTASAGYAVEPDPVKAPVDTVLAPYLKNGRLCLPVVRNYMGGYSLSAPAPVLDALFKLRDAGKLYFDGASSKGAMYSFKKDPSHG